MAIYEARCDNCGIVEVEKRMEAPFPPVCVHCGGKLQRVYNTHRIIYNAPGFDGYDNQMKRQIGSDRYARFEKEREALRKQHAVQNRAYKR